jgi:hypothetical protein
VNASVMAWFAATDEADLFTTVFVLGEARRGWSRSVGGTRLRPRRASSGYSYATR